MERRPVRLTRSIALLSALGWCVPEVHAFGLADLAEMNEELADQQVLEAIDAGREGNRVEVSGDHLQTLIDAAMDETSIEEADEEAVCQSPTAVSDPARKQRKRRKLGEKRRRKRALKRTSHTEVLFVADLGNPVDRAIQQVNETYFDMDPLSAQEKLNQGLQGKSIPRLDSQSLKAWVQKTMDASETMGASLGAVSVPGAKPGGAMVGALNARTPADPNAAANYFVEALIMSSQAETGLNEYQLRDKLAQVINEVAANDEEKFFLLGKFASRLYRNYNPARSPGFNNPENNPLNQPVPSGDLTLNQNLQAAYQMNPFSGGVCNDISEHVAMIGEKLFPGKDVLAINGGTHFGVIVSDGKNTRVIDGGSQFLTEDHLSLLPENLTPNARVSKVVNGQLKEIAVVDTQVGQVLSRAYGLDQPLVMTDRPVTDVLASAKRVWERSDQKRKELSVTGGTAKLDGSQMLVGVVKYESETKNSDFYFGTGAASQEFRSGHQSFLVHFKSGVDRTLVRYTSPRVQLKYDAGVHVGATAGTSSYANSWMNPGAISIYSISGQMNLRNRVRFQSLAKRPDGVSVQGTAQVIHSLGAKSWGATGGAVSDFRNVNTGQILRNVGFHLNQLHVDVNATKPISRTTSSVTTATYQGTAIGQRVDLTTGIEVKVPSGYQVYYFVGYSNSDIRGFQTQNSLLTGPTGGKAGVKVQNRRGMSLQGEVEGLGGSGTRGGATLGVPLKSGTKRRGR